MAAVRDALRIGCLVTLIAMAGEAQPQALSGLAATSALTAEARGSRTGARLLVAAGDQAGGWFDGRQDVLVVAAAELPRSASAYLHVSAITIDANALGRLDEGQLRALLEFIGRCGRAVFANVEPRAYRAIVQHAGCGGRFTAMAHGDSAAGAALDALLARAPNSLPGARALRELIGHSNPDLRLMAVFLGGFLSLFLVLMAIRPARVAALPFCLLAAALPGLLWAGGSRQSFAAWAEARADDRVARYSSLDVAAALGRGNQRLGPAALARTPRAIDGNGITPHWSDVPHERHLQWSTTLLQEMRLSSVGSFPLAPGLRAAAADGVVRVCNLGGGASRPGWLHWRGDTWRLPALAPGETWTVAEQARVTERTPAIRLFERRSSPLAPSLLQPLALPGDGGDRQAWLVRIELDAPGVRPCRG